MALAVFRQHLVEGLDAFHADDAVQLLAGEGEVLAEALVHRHPACAQFVLDHLLEQRRAAAAAGCGPGACLDPGEVAAAAVDGGADRALADVVAGAHGGAGRQRVGAQRRGRLAGREDQHGRIGRQLDAVLRVLQQGVVVAVVADQYGAQHLPAVGGDHQAAVAAAGLVDEAVAA
ncbi:hypothetical protein FQZ97_611530 [compost metagenome]